MKKIFVSFLLLTVSAFGQTFPAKYHTYSEGVSEMQSLVASYPTICRLDSIGYSNRDSVTVYCLKISDNAAIDEDEAAIFICSGVHADEIIGPEVSIGFAKDILNKYVLGDTAIVRYVNNLEIFIVPFTNPDGHIYVEQGHLAWRKNLTDNDGNGITDNHDGVDNNRNYDFGWSIDAGDSVTSPDSIMYKGPAPFSESENRNIAALGWKYRPLVALDYHSPTYGRPEVAYYNWYWYASQGGHGAGPDDALMADLCRQYASRIVNDAGDSSYEARRGLVNKGDFKTYFYGNFGSVAFSVEISDTTIQDTGLVDGIIARHLPAEYYLLSRALGPGINGTIRDSVTLAPLEAEVQVLERINTDINPRLSRPDYGRYRRVLAAGTYTLRFIKSGYQTKDVANVVVGSTAPTVLNVKLWPTSGTPPLAPIVISPSGGQVVDSAFVNLIWHRASTATGYILEIANDTLFNNIFERDSSVTDTVYRNLNNFINGNYYWRVTAFNAYGNSPRSSRASFVVGIKPPAPVVINPVNDTTFDTAYVNFIWHKSSTATRYTFELDNDSTFATPLVVDSSVIDTTYRNLAPLANGRCFWRVTAFNAYGNSPRSTRASFIIDIISITFIPGDVNNDLLVRGSDVTYLVRYFKGIGAPPPIVVDGYYPAADANGDCFNRGSDVTYLVIYFKGGSPPVDGHCFK
jgi:hypothetical protein